MKYRIETAAGYPLSMRPARPARVAGDVIAVNKQILLSEPQPADWSWLITYARLNSKVQAKVRSLPDITDLLQLPARVIDGTLYIRISFMKTRRLHSVGFRVAGGNFLTGYFDQPVQIPSHEVFQLPFHSPYPNQL